MLRILAIAVFVCAATLYVLGKTDAPDAPTIEVPRGEPVLAEPKPPPPATRPPGSVIQSQTDVIAFDAVLRDENLSREQRIRALQGLGPGALSAPSARNVIASDRTAADMERSGTRRQRNQPDEYDLRIARRRVDVTMYSTSWCGVCKKAKAYFVENDIAFTEHDVDKDETARADHQELNPRRSVPTIKIDKEVMIGFGAKSFRRLVDKAARARLN